MKAGDSLSDLGSVIVFDEPGFEDKTSEREREREILTRVKTQRDMQHFVHICVGH